MPKICTLCGYAPDPDAEQEDIPENCPNCGGINTVEDVEEDEEIE
jgi:predicted  nucleic acid-binding Zn-ribbon protein